MSTKLWILMPFSERMRHPTSSGIYLIILSKNSPVSLIHLFNILVSPSFANDIIVFVFLFLLKLPQSLHSAFIESSLGSILLLVPLKLKFFPIVFSKSFCFFSWYQPKVFFFHLLYLLNFQFIEFGFWQFFYFFLLSRSLPCGPDLADFWWGLVLFRKVKISSKLLIDVRL